MATQFKVATDFRKSLEARLKKLAETSEQDLQRLRRKVAFDRLLARIFHNNREAQFFLKGGYAMELRFDQARATRDIDLTYLERFTAIARSDITEEIFQTLRDLSQIDLNDFFVYRIGEAQLDLDNAPYGGARFPVSSFVDGRLFVRFQIDIGLDILVSHIEKVKGNDWLEYCGIPSPILSVITEEQQFAEKIHAYTLPRDGRVNSRVKDLTDLLLLLEKRKFDLASCKQVLQTVFRVRGTHPLPEKLLPPPDHWENIFQKMAKECGINPEITHAFARVNNFFQDVLRTSSDGVG
ncbi:MAG: nucleotidyl transferase AbiEii/AbiGii toxin family protein [Chlamydiia bacterium]|nr:nucleotidyl transferase AbiEii/AbiGii toxin family protein [Chlamydiia bacterium]